MGLKRAVFEQSLTHTRTVHVLKAFLIRKTEGPKVKKTFTIMQMGESLCLKYT